MSRRHRRDESASAMLLVPTGILIVLILAAITVDAAAAFMGERSAASIASAAANDAATLALDVEYFRSTGEYQIKDDIGDAAAIVTAAAMVQAGDMFMPGTMHVQVTVLDPTRVEVLVSGDIDRLILPSFAGGPFHISAKAIGTIDITE